MTESMPKKYRINTEMAHDGSLVEFQFLDPISKELDTLISGFVPNWDSRDYNENNRNYVRVEKRTAEEALRFKTEIVGALEAEGFEEDKTKKPSW